MRVFGWEIFGKVAVRRLNRSSLHWMHLGPPRRVLLRPLAKSPATRRRVLARLAVGPDPVLEIRSADQGQRQWTRMTDRPSRVRLAVRT